MEQLNLSNISYTTLDKEIFHNLSLTIPKGVGVSIIGPSGSGKTTLARILAGRIRYRGSIKINGVEIVRSNLYLLRRYVAVVFHDKYVNKNTVINELFDSMNDLNLELEEEEARTKKIIEYFKLDDELEKRICNFDVELKNYIKIIKELVRNPVYLVIDDLFIDMIEDMIKRIISYCKKNKITIINITTDMDYVTFFSNLVVLYNKEIAMEGKTIECLKEEKLLRRLGFDLPFMIDLSIQLGYYGLLDRIITDNKEMIKEIWKS